MLRMSLLPKDAYPLSIAIVPLCLSVREGQKYILWIGYQTCRSGRLIVKCVSDIDG